jgi:hypothetical protein
MGLYGERCLSASARTGFPAQRLRTGNAVRVADGYSVEEVSL